MAYGTQAYEYQKNAALGASPVGLVVMLYDGSIRFMERARRAIQDKNLQEQNHCLQKAQRIVTELMGTLNMQQGGEISRNLLNLYLFVFDQLVLANLNDDVSALDAAQKTMSELREGWALLEKQMKIGQLPASEVPNAA